MKDHVDKSIGIVTRIEEDLVKIKDTESLRLAKSEVRKKRNCSDSSIQFRLKLLRFLLPGSYETAQVILRSKY